MNTTLDPLTRQARITEAIRGADPRDAIEAAIFMDSLVKHDLGEVHARSKYLAALAVAARDPIVFAGLADVATSRQLEDEDDAEGDTPGMSPNTIADLDFADGVPTRVFMDLKAYVLKHERPSQREGRFVQAVLANDLRGAVARSTPELLEALPDILLTISRYVPQRAHGSPAKVERWLMERPL